VRERRFKSDEEKRAWSGFLALREKRDKLVVQAEGYEVKMAALAEKWGWEGV